ncbi:MAG: GNAT family N-acetyltransferase [Salinivirgaceae bacterium]|nr:GNAT family N-acetyltransferase [Salinivirgaceae bacterium]
MKTISRIATTVVGIVILLIAFYIMANRLGLIDELDFGAGAYFYADIPNVERFDTSTYVTIVPRWVHIVLFLVWGFLMYKLWCFVEKRGNKMNEIIIEDWNPKFQPDFERLNRQWIEKYFVVEQHDIDVLTNPQQHIIDLGGHILVAKINNEVVGCVALMFRPADGEYELTKLAVSPNCQNQGLGKKLINSIINYARNKGISRIVLETNSSLHAANHLYQTMGFSKVQGFVPSYNRADLKYEMELCS